MDSTSPGRGARRARWTPARPAPRRELGIALAKERGAQLLIDESRGRHVASELGIHVIGTLRILDEAKRRGKIKLVRPVIIQMQSRGYRFERSLILQFLERVGEA